MNKQNLITFFVLFFSFLNQGLAQINISGKVSDPNYRSVGNALVEIFDQKDTLKKYSATTDLSGNFIVSNITDIEKFEQNLPNDYLIVTNYPNPFNPSTIIHFEIPKAENIEIKIFDILGREIRTLFNAFHKAGVDQINWNGRNNFNQGVSAGIYLCQLRTKNNFKVHKMVLLDGGIHSSGIISYNKISNQNIQKPAKVNTRFNFTVKVTGDSLDATYFRNLICTKDTTLNLIVSKIIKTETIGIEGGIVGGDDFKVSIPNGAFDGNYNISLIKIEDDEVFGENTVTPSFKLKGIPNNYAKPIKIIGKYSGELNGDSYLGFGESKITVLENNLQILYDFYSAKDSAEYLWSIIYPNRSSNLLSKQTKEDELEIFLKFFSGYMTTETQHFSIRVPIVFFSKIVALPQILEDVYTVIYEGFEMPRGDSEYFVNIQSLGFEVGMRPNVKRDAQFYIDNESIINQSYNIIQFKMAQGLFYFSTHPHEIYMATAAFMSWIEDLLNSDPDYYYPSNFLATGLSVFNGLFNFNSENQRDHGIGLSAVIKYFKDFQNMEYRAIGNYYKSSDIYSQYDEFLKLVESPVTAWLPDFYQKYISNELFELPDDYFIKNAHAEWNINSEEDVSKIFTDTYPDLSAKIFKINLNYSELDNTQNLKFNIKGPDNNKDLSLLLFSIKNNKLEFIETTQLAEYELFDPKSYFEGGTNGFLAVLVNSNITEDDYSGQSVVDLEVKVTPKLEPPALPYNKCKITLLNLVVYEHSEYSNSDPVDGSREFDYVSGSVPGKFSGKTFKGIFEETVGNQTYKDTIEIVLNETHDTISYLSWQKGYYYTDEINSVFSNEHFDFIANNIELSGPLADQYAYFQKDGFDVCSLINYFYLYSTSDTPTSSSSRWSTGHDCTGTSRLQIVFGKD